jgi:hypothetical protein
MAVYFKSFDLIRLDASGVRLELPNEELLIKKVSDDSLVDTVESDDFGYVSAPGGISGTAGLKVYFEHATYPEKFYQTLGASEDGAVSEFYTFIVEDLFTSTTETPVIDIFIQEDGSTSIDYLGSLAPGTTASFPKEVASSKNFTLYSVPRDSSGQRRTTSFEQSKNTSLSVTVQKSNYVIKDFFTSEENDAGTETELYVTEVPANTLLNNGDKLRAVFAGTFAANANNKIVSAYFNTGDYIFSPDTATTQSGGSWRLEIDIIRSGAGSYVSTVHFSRSGSSSGYETQLFEVTGVDYDETVNLILSGEGVSASDVVAKFGYVEFIGAAVAVEEGEGGEVSEGTDTVLHRIDCGRTTGGTISEWEQDAFNNGGTAYNYETDLGALTVNTATATDPAPESAYTFVRLNSPIIYTFTGLNSAKSHKVRLHFCRSYQYFTLTMDISINGSLVDNDFVFSNLNMLEAHVREYTVASGVSSIEVTVAKAAGDAANAQVSGIEIIELA